MRISTIMFAFVAFVVAPLGHAAAPSESSVRELLEVTQVRKLVDGMMGQVDQMMKAAIQQAVAQRPGPADAKALAERMQERFIVVLKEELAWSAVEPIYIAVYQQTFTQEEIDGMIAFYRTPVGASVITKMPLAVQNSMVAMQARLAPMMKKMEQIQAEVMREAQAQAAANGPAN